jgi:hypothetical protein
VGTDDLGVTEYVINYEDKPFQTISIMDFEQGRVIRETHYFAEPAWRSQWVEHGS